MDGRTKARKQFDAIAQGIVTDLGGEGQLTTVQRALIEAFAGTTLAVNALNMAMLLGKSVDIGELSQAASTLVRIASRIGIHRIPRDVTDPLTYASKHGEAAS